MDRSHTINQSFTPFHSTPSQSNQQIKAEHSPFNSTIPIRGSKMPSRYELTNRIGFLQPHAVFGVLREHSLSHVVVLRVVKSTRVRMMVVAVMGHEVLLADVLFPIDHGGFAIWVGAGAAAATADAAARCRGHVIPSSAKDHSSHRIELVRCVLGKWEDWRRMKQDNGSRISTVVMGRSEARWAHTERDAGRWSRLVETGHTDWFSSSVKYKEESDETRQLWKSSNNVNESQAEKNVLRCTFNHTTDSHWLESADRARKLVLSSTELWMAKDSSTHGHWDILTLKTQCWMRRKSQVPLVPLVPFRCNKPSHRTVGWVCEFYSVGIFLRPWNANKPKPTNDTSPFCLAGRSSIFVLGYSSYAWILANEKRDSQLKGVVNLTIAWLCLLWLLCTASSGSRVHGTQGWSHVFSCHRIFSTAFWID